jgi:hypothetical protein
MGHPTEALASYKQACAIWERLAREHPDITDIADRLIP